MSSPDDRVIPYETPASKREDYVAPPPFNRSMTVRRTIFWIVSCGIILLIALLLLPRVTRRGPIQVICMSHMRQIGIALQIYAAEHHGAYPDSLATLVLYKDNGRFLPKLLCCPETTATPLSPATTQQSAASIGNPANCSYLYLRPTTRPSNTQVILLETTTVHRKGTAANVLLGNGGMESIKNPQLQSILQQINSGHYPVLLK
jgi:hypothetical protein